MEMYCKDHSAAALRTHEPLREQLRHNFFVILGQSLYNYKMYALQKDVFNNCYIGVKIRSFWDTVRCRADSEPGPTGEVSSFLTYFTLSCCSSAL